MFRILVFLLIPFFVFAKQTVCLNMIVKNESKAIRRCLSSVKPLIDYWVISDTGSTDGTQAIIREFMKDIPGELHQDEWRDFAHNRNLALQYAKGKGDYLLFIDADEEFVYSNGFKFPHLQQDYYLFNVINERNGISLSEYKRILLVSNQLDWTWKGVLHEVISCPEAKRSSNMTDIKNISRTEDGGRYQDPQKFVKDAQILEKALEKEPNNSRYVFYIARSYLNANEKEKALKYFHQRILMDPESSCTSEIYASLYCIGLLQLELGHESDKVISNLTAAHQLCPSRAEPLYYLGIHFMKQNNNFLADLIFEKALSIRPAANDGDTLETWIYQWAILYKHAECLFNLCQFEKSKKVIEKLLAEGYLPQEDQILLRNNLKVIDSYLSR